MFKKKLKTADPTDRRADLRIRLSSAETNLEKLRADAVIAASTDPEALPALSEQAARLEFEADALSHAIDQAEQEIEEAADIARREADRVQREATAAELRKLADGLEKACVGLPDAMRGILAPLDAAKPVFGDNGHNLAILLTNLATEIPDTIAMFVSEIRARSDATVAGQAPPTLPAPFVPVVIPKAEPLPQVTLFVLTKISWPIDAHGNRATLGQYTIGSCPEFFAGEALKRGAALLLDDDRYKKMRENARKVGWPHTPDPMRVINLDRDPDERAIYSSSGKFLRHEVPENYRVNEPVRQVGIKVMLP